MDEVRSPGVGTKSQSLSPTRTPVTEYADWRRRRREGEDIPVRRSPLSGGFLGGFDKPELRFGRIVQRSHPQPDHLRELSNPQFSARREATAATQNLVLAQGGRRQAEPEKAGKSRKRFREPK
jgi:hypothetical protein